MKTTDTVASDKPEINQDTPIKRTLPVNLKAEQMLLGAVIINPELLNQVNDLLLVEHFYEALHQKIYKAIETLVDKGIIPTIITLDSMLDRDELFIKFGSSEYLTKITAIAMMVINARDYAKLIYDLAIKRNLINIGEDIVNTAYNSNLEQEAQMQIEKAEDNLYNLINQGINNRSFVNIGTSIKRSLENIDRAIHNADHVAGISTGFKALDDILHGFQDSDLIILAGRPAMGKTAFAINLALNACKSLETKATQIKSNHIKSVGFFSLEMSAEQLANRMLSIDAQINTSLFLSGKINEEQYNNLRRSSVDLSDLQFFIDDTPALSIAAIRTRARRLKRKNHLGVLFVDYLQLLKGTHKADNRVLEITEITQGLKSIAKELNVPVIALSQLSRAVESREDKRPMLSDLRESGSIEQDSDLVMFIHRDEYYLLNKKPQAGTEKYDEWMANLNKAHNKAEIIIAKHRNGPIGNVLINYDRNYSKFTEADKKENAKIANIT